MKRTYVSSAEPARATGCAAWLLACAMVGCAAEVERRGDDGDRRPADGAHTCNGAIGATPTVIASGLDTGELLVAGDTMVVVETVRERVVAVDRCGGPVEVLAELPFPQSAAVLGDVVFVLSDDQIWRIPLDGNDAAPLGMVLSYGDATIASNGVGIYATTEILQEDGSVDADAVHDVGLHRVDPATGALHLETRIELDVSAAINVRAASGRGLHYILNCRDCPDTVWLAPFGGGAPAEMPDTRGAWAFAVAGDRAYAASLLDARPFTDTFDIVRMSLRGGDTDVLAARDHDHTNQVWQLAADGHHVCWSPQYQPPRCMRDEPGAEVHRLGDPEDETAHRMVLRDQVLHWLRDDGAGGKELVAATVDGSAGP